ncbi:MAG: LarC family nickel insertion protein, partial [Oscillospiraceae bacterium]|nr:LarC family nickel insertion protein [Oscillospiraceae bacterium]
MKLHFDCAMGAAGDMITAALYELLPDKAAFLTKFRTALAACPALDGAEILPEASVKCAIAGTHMRVTVRGEEEISDDVSGHAHTRAHAYTHIHSHARVHERGGKNYSYTDILALISGLALSDKAKSDAKGVFALIARAEAKVHGLAPDALSNVHFHELGSLDALIDVTAVCALMDELSVTEVTSSPVHVGAGAVRTAHGVLPVPTPATAELLLGVPSYGGSIRGELCTPTGAALLRYFVSRFGEMSVTPLKIGYGMGSKDFDRCNCVRAFLCDDGASETDTICRLECNLDDMT